MGNRKERNIHAAFEATVIVKGIHALLETIGGTALFFVSQQVIVQAIASVTRGELSEDPTDLVAGFLRQSAESLTVGSQHFAAAYLLAHGIINGFLVVNLLRERLWAFPVTIVLFSMISVYQLFRYGITHSPWLLFLTAVDIAVVWLSWREYQYRKVRPQ